MDKILTALDEQKKQFMQQIATIDMARAIYVKGQGTKAVGKTSKRGNHTMSAAARKKISIAKKAYWAAKKKAKG